MACSRAGRGWPRSHRSMFHFLALPLRPEDSRDDGPERFPRGAKSNPLVVVDHSILKGASEFEKE